MAPRQPRAWSAWKGDGAMATMAKKNGKWTVYWTDGAGKKRSKVVSTRKRDAERFLARKIQERDRGISMGYKAVSFSDVAKEYMDRVAAVHYKPTTLGNAERYLRLRLLPAFGEMPAGEITPRDVDAFISDRMKHGAAPGSVRNEVGFLAVVMKYAERWGYSVGNPARGAGLPKAKRPEISVLSAAQARSLIAATPERYRCLIATALLTGMRAGELAGLMERDIDFGHHVIRIQRSAWRGSLTTPKTEHSYRSIDMPPTLERMLEEWLDSSLRDKGSGLVFPNKWGGVQNMSNVRENVLVPALARAGLPRLRFHDLRHTYAAILIANGESLKYVQEMMGHSSIKITADTYGHLLAEVHRNAAARLDSAVFGELSAAWAA